jgi:peptide/nickel transport system substrate-binding protein
MFSRRSVHRHSVISRLRSWKVITLILLALTAVALPDLSKVRAGGRGTGGTLRLLYWQSPTILNPHLSVGDKDLNASRISYEPLASVDQDGKVVPNLAAEIPSLENGGLAKDGLSVTWNLKQDVKWSDGEPFTADDVLFTYEYISNPAVQSTSAPTYAIVKNIEVVGKHTVKVNFNGVNTNWSLPFVGSQGMIIPRHVFKEFVGANAKDAPANLKPVGTGAYRLVDYRTEDILVIGEDTVNVIKIIYEPNPFYREPDEPYFSRIELSGGGGDAKTAARALQLGQIDYSGNLVVDNATLDAMEAGGKAKAIIQFGAFVERIMINFTDPNKETADGERSSTQFPHPFFTDRKVRQALAYAIDRKAIVAAYGRSGLATDNILASPPLYLAPNSLYTFDLKKAAALLDEAGWKDTNGDGIRDKGGGKMKLVFLTSINPVRQQAQDIVKKALESIGVQVELKKVDSSIFFGPPEESTNTRRQFYADLEEFSYSNKSPDPTAYMAGWTCDQIAQKSNNWSFTNWARYCNPAYDALYKQAATEIDFGKRQQLFTQMNKLLYDDVAVIPLVQLSNTAGISTTLQNVEFSPWEADTWKIEDWTRE